MPTETRRDVRVVEHAAHGGGVAVVVALVAVAQVGVGIELQHDEVAVARRERSDGARRQRMLAAEHERETRRPPAPCSTMPDSCCNAASTGVAMAGGRSVAMP